MVLLKRGAAARLFSPTHQLLETPDQQPAPNLAEAVEELHGTVVTDPESVQALYNAGDFLYQYTNRKGRLSPILLCDSPRTLQEAVNRVGPGKPITVKSCR